LAILLGALSASAQSAAPSAHPATPGPSTPDIKQARKAYEQGHRAEQGEDWQAAFDFYTEAVAHWPGNTEYLLRRETVRFRRVQQHMDRAERQALAGRLEEARGELRAALALDPAYSVARERLEQLQPSTPLRKRQPSEYDVGPVQLQSQPGKRTFDYRGTTHGAYEEIARQFGVKATFDEDLRDRQIRFRVADLDFEMATRVLGEETGTFWRAVDEHTFLVAEDTVLKRHQYAPLAVRTVVLPSSTTPEAMTETVRLVRDIAGIARTELDSRSRTLTMRASPEDLALATQLIQEVEQAPGELMLEIEILEVDRNLARQLGITPPTSGRILQISRQDVQQALRSPSALAQVIQRLFGISPVFGAQVLIPPLVAFGGGRTVFFATLPGAAADFAQTLSLVRSGRRMLLRAEDGHPATFFVGERFPIALALLSPSFSASQFIPPVSATQFPRTDLTTGEGPAAVVIADFNGDNRPDLAVANQTSNTVSIFLGQGNGTFGSKTDFTAGNAPVSLATGDFNGDGKPDLAVTNKSSNTVSILLGDGTGAFSPGTALATGNNPLSVATGDFNRDGRPDLAVVNQASNTISIFLNQGNGTFGPKTDFPTGNGPVSVAMGDFNGDGLPDLAVVNQASNTISIFLNQGNGTFGPKTDFPTANRPVAVVASDFNVDGRLDLAMTDRDSNTVSVLLGNGDGTFNPKFDLGVGNSPAGLAAGDLNGDSRPDLAVANQASNTVSVILNTNVFTSVPAVPQAPYPGFQYEDLGLKVRAVPRLHPNHEVTLQLQFEIRNRSGVVLNSIPVITNRTVEQTVRLREDETTVLAGILQQEEVQEIRGWPGLSRAHGVGRLAGRHNKQKNETELLIVITPRRIRLAPRVERSIYAGREPVPVGRSALAPTQP